MKVRDIIFMIVFAPVMYAFYAHMSQVAGTELTFNVDRVARTRYPNDLVCV